MEPKVACLDTDYRDDGAQSACIVIDGWASPHSIERRVAWIADVAEYVPGQFYRRELPCLLAVLREVRSPLDVIVVDGYVWLGERAGLGAHLYDALHRTTPVVGVAKNAYAGATTARAILRGESARPLYVTAAGMDVDDAATAVRGMHGDHRLPTMLLATDRLARATSVG
ncbi:endonuclease V [Haliangium sp.]|uniref:endonuclease V n=1 Tax=Haliangium sp. TaxID=2663208 RepID=UPI003D106123